MKLNLESYFAHSHQAPFSERWAVMPFRGAIPVAAEQIQHQWSELQQNVLPKNKRLLYVHIPFCATHCTFCGFYQNPLKNYDTDVYTQYLIQELLRDVQCELTKSAPIHAVYFGGGTPSALTAMQLHQIINTIKNNFPLAPDCEITIEGRILNFDDDKIDACLEAGANRFSIGIQTFDSDIRHRLSRTSNREGAIRFLQKLGERDKAAIVCDLIFGLPRQTEKTWREDLAIIRDLPLDGVDLYALNLLPTTPLFKSVENKRITLPTAQENSELYRIGAETLDEFGWNQLSNSHWGRTTRERNLYNILIKQGADYLAFGSCAGGKLGDKSFMLNRNLSNYYEQLDNNEKPLAMLLQGNVQLKWLHHLQSGIECGHVDLTKMTEHSHLLSPLITQWYQTGLVNCDKSCFKLTTSGRFWASNLLSALQKVLMQINEPELANTQQQMPNFAAMKAGSAVQHAQDKSRQHPH